MGCVPGRIDKFSARQGATTRGGGGCIKAYTHLVVWRSMLVESRHLKLDQGATWQTRHFHKAHTRASGRRAPHMQQCCRIGHGGDKDGAPDCT
jgi:hypothetical protein